MITFDVHGLPAPQGSKTAVNIGGKARLINAGGSAGRERHTNWRSAVADAARAHAGEEPLDGPLAVSLVFRFPMPKSRSKRVREVGDAAKTTAPDLDKLVRATLDGLMAGGLICDDARVCRLVAVKREVVGWTGCAIRVTQWEDE